MSPHECKAELAELLAAAFLRIERNLCLPISGNREPDASPVDADETRFAFGPAPDEETA
jgi:hypothetical protein